MLGPYMALPYGAYDGGKCLQDVLFVKFEAPAVHLPHLARAAKACAPSSTPLSPVTVLMISLSNTLSHKPSVP